MSATASAALSHNFDPPRSTLGTAADLQYPECEKLLLPLKLRVRRLPGIVLTLKPLITAPPLTAVETANWREHACRASDMTEAVCLAVRTTPAIVFLSSRLDQVTN